jgi:hypothetical protein
VFANGILFATVEYPLVGKRTRLGAMAGSVRAFLYGIAQQRLKSEFFKNLIYLTGRLYGFVVEGRKFRTVRRNLRNLRAAKSRRRFASVPAPVASSLV